MRRRCAPLPRCRVDRWAAVAQDPRGKALTFADAFNFKRHRINCVDDARHSLLKTGQTVCLPFECKSKNATIAIVRAQLNDGRADRREAEQDRACSKEHCMRARELLKCEEEIVGQCSPLRENQDWVGNGAFKNV